MKALVALISLMALPVLATNFVESPEARIKKQVEAKFPDFFVEQVRPSKVKNIYEVALGDEIVYVSADGKYLIFGGTMLDIENEKPVNITQQTKTEFDTLKAPMRAELLAKSDVSKTVTFKAPNEKYQISVFTDIDCGYCRKLHNEMPQLNALGITVHYYGFPRSGLDSPSHKKLVDVWCAKDPKAAMTAAKNERSVASNACKNPLVDHFNMVRQMGLAGTPAIILKDGTLLPGYMPPDRLLEQIKLHLG